MEIEVTKVFQADWMEFSASQMELGPNAGRITWENSMSAEELHCIEPSQTEEIIDWLEDFGAWTEEELRAMSFVELNALFLQFVSSEFRELEHLADDLGMSFEEAAMDESSGGRLYASANAWYFYVGV